MLVIGLAVVTIGLIAVVTNRASHSWRLLAGVTLVACGTIVLAVHQPPAATTPARGASATLLDEYCSMVAESLTGWEMVHKSGYWEGSDHLVRVHESGGMLPYLSWGIRHCIPRPSNCEGLPPVLMSRDPERAFAAARALADALEQRRGCAGAGLDEQGEAR